MKKWQIALVVIFICSLVFVSFSSSQDIKKLKAGIANTVKLPNGDIVYDLNGEWDTVYDNREFGISKDIVKVTQEGNKFVGIKLIGNEYVGKGSETIKGELEGDRFKSVYVRLVTGWTASKGKISDGGNKIVLETSVEEYGYTGVTTLSRK